LSEAKQSKATQSKAKQSIADADADAAADAGHAEIFFVGVARGMQVAMLPGSRASGRVFLTSSPLANACCC